VIPMHTGNRFARTYSSHLTTKPVEGTVEKPKDHSDPRLKRKSGMPKKRDHQSSLTICEDGSIWAKGKMRDGKFSDYWEWFRRLTRDGSVVSFY
jgi:hypothetical protein